MALEETLRIDTDADLADLDKAIDKIDEVGSALSDIERAGEQASRGTDKASGGLSSLVGWLGKAAGAIGALGIVAGIGGVLAGAVGGVLEWNTALNLMEAQTGATAAQIEEYRTIGQDIYKSGWGEGVQDVVASMSQVERITQASGDALRNMTQDAIVVRDVFGADIVESTRTADTLMNQFGIDGQRAFDLITVGFQKTGDPAGDLLDTFNEYSGNFSQMGFSADMFLNLLNQGLEAGAYNTDSVADAMREFNIRLQDGTSAGAFRSMGTEMSQMFDAFQRGDETAAGFFEDMIGQLRDIEDPIRRNALGVEIFGTKWEDLGEDVLLALDPTSTAIGAFDDIAGATDRAGNSMQKGLGPALERLKRTGMTFLANFLEPFVVGMIDEAVPAIEDFSEFLTDDAAPAIEELADTLGHKAAPVLEDIAVFAEDAGEAIGEFAAEVSGFVARNPQVLTYLQYFAMALGVLIAAAAGIAAVSAVLSGVAVVLGLIFSPIVLIAAALAALGLAYKENLFGFRDAVDDVAGRVGEAFGRIRDFVAGLIDAFKAGGLEGAQQFIQDKLITPITEAVQNINWGQAAATLWNNFKTALGVALALIWQVSVWIGENIVQPIFDYLSNVNWGEVAATLWRNFKTVMATALALYWQASVWIGENVIMPIFDYLRNVNWGEVAATLWSKFKAIMTTAILLHFQAALWVRDNIITPVVNAITGIDWGAVITTIGNLGSAVFDKLKGTLPDIGVWVWDNIIAPIIDALSGLEAAVKGAINSAIPNSFHVGTPALVVAGETIFPAISRDISIPDPFPGYMSGTPWTGSGARNQTAGYVHNQEAVVPPGGMRVYPSPNGLMLEGAGGGQPLIIPITLELDGRVLLERLIEIEGRRVK